MVDLVAHAVAPQLDGPFLSEEGNEDLPGVVVGQILNCVELQSAL